MTPADITGSLIIRRLGLLTGDRLAYEWQDGDVIGISRELLTDCDDGIFSTRTPNTDAQFMIGPFHVVCIGIDERLIYARRDYSQDKEELT